MNIWIEKNGVVIRRAKNRVVADGREIVRNLLCNAGRAPNCIALGTGATAVADSDVQLETEVFRNALTRVVLSPSKARLQTRVLTTQANGYSITELGLVAGDHVAFDTNATGITTGGGTLFARAVIDAIAKTASDTLTITWDIPITYAED